MKTLLLFGLASIALSACDQPGSSNAAMDRFQRDPPTNFAGGAMLPSGDYAKYSIQADSKNVQLALEMRVSGQCKTSSGSVSVDQLGEAHDEIRLAQMKVQSEPETWNDQAEYGRLFLHLIGDNATPAPCSGAPAALKDAGDLAPTNVFAKFNLSPSLLALASPEALHGSNVYMKYFRADDIGLAFNAASGALIGIDIPKRRLFSDSLFTVNRDSLMTQISATEIPLLFDAKDKAVVAHREEITAAMTYATDPAYLKMEIDAGCLTGSVYKYDEKLVNEIASSPETKQRVLETCWSYFIKH